MVESWNLRGISVEGGIVESSGGCEIISSGCEIMSPQTVEQAPEPWNRRGIGM